MLDNDGKPVLGRARMMEDQANRLPNRKERMLGYSIAGRVPRSLSRQCPITMRPVEVITLKSQHHGQAATARRKRSKRRSGYKSAMCLTALGRGSSFSQDPPRGPTKEMYFTSNVKTTVLGSTATRKRSIGPLVSTICGRSSVGFGSAVQNFTNHIRARVPV
jgi:hypothetical protein